MTITTRARAVPAHEETAGAVRAATGGVAPKEGTHLSNAILTHESTIREVREAARLADVLPGVILEMIEHRPEWADAYDVEIDEGQQLVTYSREVGTVEIRQSFRTDTWAVVGDGPEPVVAFYSYEDARANGWPKPEVRDVFRAVDILQACGEWQPEAGS